MKVNNLSEKDKKEIIERSAELLFLKPSWTYEKCIRYSIEEWKARGSNGEDK